MMRRYFKITIIFLFMLLSTTLAHAEVRVRAKVLSNELVYAGDPFIYQIILEGAEKAGSTNVMEKLAEFNPQGPDIQTSSQTTIINGKINQSVSYNMNYQLSVNQMEESFLPPD